MELMVEELGALKRKLKIKIPGDVVSRRVKDAYRDLNRQIQMPGFRPGKIPQHILEKQVPVQSFTKLFQELMQEYYDKALKETGIVPAGSPEIDHSDLNEVKRDAPLSFSVVLDIRPNIPLIPYKGWKFKKKEPAAGENEVEAAICKIIQPFGKLEPFDDSRAIEKGDYVVMDFEGSLKGEPLENGSARNFTACIGEKKTIPGFEDQLVGRKKGEEFTIKAALPANWNNKLRRVSMPVPGSAEDKELDIAEFKVNVREIKKLVLPELTDEFVRRKEIGMESVERFRRTVKSDLQAFKDHEEEYRIKEEIFNKLVKETDFQPPDSVVNKELRFMVDGMKYQIAKSGMKLEDSGFDEELARKEWREKAVFNAKGYMILDVIAAQERIVISQGDIEEEYKRLAQETGQKPEEVRARLHSNQESLEQTVTRLRGQKALNLVYAHCEFEYVK
ncbi:MAG: trigger factor [Nitrospinae bacterium]|nr:trigger factor [Nitrospinota bacterium]